MSDNRTMIGLPKTNEYVVEEIALPIDENGAPAIIEIAGEQYAKLPEGWPAEEEPSLLEAHVEHVISQGEGLSAYEEELYSFTPAEVKELAEGYIDMANEVRALRKGMKTMQRKTRKQAQQQRRLERRLSQARAGRERAQATANHYFRASLLRGVEEMKQGKTVEL